jgi:hypothetical protein
MGFVEMLDLVGWVLDQIDMAKPSERLVISKLRTQTRILLCLIVCIHISPSCL